MAPADRLKLRARDAADMAVIASCLQDALVPLSEVAFLREERRLVMVCNRFMWERLPDDDAQGGAASPADEAAGDASFEEAEARPTYYRVNCGVTFNSVQRVASQGLDLKDKRQILNLLTIQVAPKHVTLLFSGGGMLRLTVSHLRCHLEDIGEPWPTWSRPEHALDEADAPR